MSKKKAALIGYWSSRKNIGYLGILSSVVEKAEHTVYRDRAERFPSPFLSVSFSAFFPSITGYSSQLFHVLHWHLRTPDLLPEPRKWNLNFLQKTLPDGSVNSIVEVRPPGKQSKPGRRLFAGGFTLYNLDLLLNDKLQQNNSCLEPV